VGGVAVAAGMDAPAHLHRKLGAHARASSGDVFLTLLAATARSRRRLSSNGCFISTLPLFGHFITLFFSFSMTAGSFKDLQRLLQLYIK
jgi:hypothetical protein